METGKLPTLHELLRIPTGSERYGLFTEKSDHDIFILTPDTYMRIYDSDADTACFVWSVEKLNTYWAHPLRLADLTGECAGKERLCTFLRTHRREITYAAPARTAILGMEYIAQGEVSGYDSPIKAGLRTAMILSHMAVGAEDPFLLSEGEKATLLRARTGDVPPEERVEIYRSCISPEHIGRLMRMPDHPTIKNELFQLIEEELSC